MTTKTFNYTGGYQYFTVPANVSSLTVELKGAGSGSAPGGTVTGTMAVKPGQVLCVVVGGQGKANSGSTGGAGGWGGGRQGGNAHSANGGDGGGGYVAVRLGSASGKVLCVAGGAGGQSGDGGAGGAGGGIIGGTGGKGSAGSGSSVTAATGGSQVAGGHYGEYYGGSQNTKGGNGSSVILGSAGQGGSSGAFDGPGGGGGGGGYFPGGGGGGGSTGYGSGGGGGGGSNYTGVLTSPNTRQGTGNYTNGSATFIWTASGGTTKPNNPSLNSPTSGTRLRTNEVTISANVSASYTTSLFLAVALYYYNGSTLTYLGSYVSPTSVPVASGSAPKTLTMKLSLATGRHYVAHVAAKDSHGVFSAGYASTDFYSNYPPDPPTLISPGDNTTWAFTSPVHFSWSHNDPDGQAQNGAQIRYRPVSSATYVTRTLPGTTTTYDSASGEFASNTFHVWQVRTADPTGLWSDWSDFRTFYIDGAPTPPILLDPAEGSGVDVTQDFRINWRFTDPDRGNTQAKADIRFRKYGDTSDADWIVRTGATSYPGSQQSWNVTGGLLQPGFEYEWSVRTYDTASGGLIPSDWAESKHFHGIATPGAEASRQPVVTNEFARTLGCGTNRAFLFVKGGKNLLGELTNVSSLTWGRTRDDISTATITVQTSNDDLACQLLSAARTWQHELVFYRDDGNGHSSRVWEGPITLIEYGRGYVTFQARDVMAWVYRRILKQGYNDAYPNNKSVVYRSARIIIDALSRDDPNILKYLTLIQFDDDAKESRVVPDYATTAWQEVDDMAAKAGLDYTTVGRRIILWDTSRAIGKLPVLRGSDFTADPILTEYGMNLATEYAVTNGNGIYGTVFTGTPNTSGSNDPKRNNAIAASHFYGAVELLVSSYGDTATGDQTTLTPSALQALKDSLTSQAVRGSADRFPTPLVARVPDNTQISPDAPITIDQLVPGVWAPLQVEHTCRTLSQWQKLDSMQVTQDSSGEVVSATWSPAPNFGQDPDADAAAEADSGN